MTKFGEFQRTLKKFNAGVAVVTEIKITVAKLTPMTMSLPFLATLAHSAVTDLKLAVALQFGLGNPSSTTTLTNMTRPVMSYYGLLYRLSHFISLFLALFIALGRVRTLMWLPLKT